MPNQTVSVPLWTSFDPVGFLKIAPHPAGVAGGGKCHLPELPWKKSIPISRCALPGFPQNFYFTSSPCWALEEQFLSSSCIEALKNKTKHLCLCSRLSFSPSWKMTSFSILFFFLPQIIGEQCCWWSQFYFHFAKTSRKKYVSPAYEIWWFLSWQWVAFISIFPVFVSRFLFAFQVWVWAGQQSHLYDPSYKIYLVPESADWF